MIYTVTFNPSLDYSIRINDFAFGGLNRIGEEAIRVGGVWLELDAFTLTESPDS